MEDKNLEIMLATQLIGLGEVQRSTFKQLSSKFIFKNRFLKVAYENHCKCQENLIKYQRSINGD